MVLERRSVRSLVVIAASIATAVCVLLPWVDAGTVAGTESVSGVDIPVMGWLSVVGCLASVIAVVAAALHGSRWLWVLANLCVGIVATCSGVTLLLLDVVDSAVVSWVLKALPDELQESSPQLAASFGLWGMFVLALVASMLTAHMTVWSARSRFGDDSSTAVSWARPGDGEDFPPPSIGYTPPKFWWEEKS